MRLPIHIALWCTTEAPFVQEVAPLGGTEALRLVEQHHNTSAALPLPWALLGLTFEHEALPCRMDSANHSLALA